MLTPEQALAEILRRSKPLKPQERSLERAWDRILASPVRAPYPYPLFDNAALDGYAVRGRDTASASEQRPVYLALQGSQFAGQFWRKRLESGQALHVTTGAPMPSGADALVPYEAVRLVGTRVRVPHPATAGLNVRRQGEDAPAGTLLAKTGDRLHARRLASLATFGVGRVKVVPAPRVAVAVSGDELLRPGARPVRGRIFDGNGPALRFLLSEAGLDAKAPTRLPDAAATQRSLLGRLLGRCDVLIVCGGMSVGERDLGKAVLEALGVRRIFWKVAQKPGKPLYFGVRGRQLVFGLPGNPAAAVTCFAAYVLPSLRALEGREPAARLRVALAHPVRANGDKALLLKARVEGRGDRARVRVLEGQGSHLLRGLADGNALVFRLARAAALEKGRCVEVLPL